jgi:hypothetical protein
MAEQTRGKNARVVDHEQIAGNQMVLEPRKLGVLDSAAVAVQHEQPRLSTVRRGLLRDELFGQCEVEVRDVHSVTLTQPGWWVVDGGV